MSSQPAAFMSYARADDEYENGLVSKLRERLSGAVHAQTGEVFPIFQDREDILWGQNWQQRIEEVLDEVTLLIPIMTPSFFKSTPCRDEVARFLRHEQQVGRGDLVLPIYFIGALQLDDPVRREADELAGVLASRQFVDWRELRYEPVNSPVVRRQLDQLALRVRDILERPPPTPPTPPGESPQAATPAAVVDATVTQSTATVRLAAKIEPPTHVVDAYQRGDYTTIGAAIQAAQAGDRILVRAGLYQEGLVIDKPLEILGDGQVQDIEVQARDTPALVFKANIGRVANLTLRQVGSTGKWYGADITQGRLELEGCDITSQSLSCVVIRNGADPRLPRNRIRDGKQSGVYVYDDGLGLLEDNDITGNGFSGVEIKSGGDPTLRRNQIHGNEKNGVSVYNDGFGLLEDNKITGNRSAGVTIRNGGNPTVRRNQIRDNKSTGVFVYDGGLGMLEDNDISANGRPGVSIMTGGNPTVRRNRIHDNQQGGVISGNDGLGMLEDNDITANGFPGVMITVGGNPTVRHNRINRNNGQAVWIGDSGRGVIEDNDLTDNTEGAWSISEDSMPNVTRSRNRE